MGRDKFDEWYFRLPKCFNPRAHVGRDESCPLIIAICRVSIHAPTWGATIYPIFRADTVDVSIHAPTWGATVARILSSGLKIVSIHAPTWGATWKRPQDSPLYEVSIHAPTWGATCGRGKEANLDGGFNPRAHVGRDAPYTTRPPSLKSFNPRAHVGRDRRNRSRSSVSARFQSTRPRGARPFGLHGKRAETCFNPRAHVGRDSLVAECCAGGAVSIHAPTWGATRIHRHQREDGDVSIHAPTWGATLAQCFVQAIKIVSIHAPTWGATVASG